MRIKKKLIQEKKYITVSSLSPKFFLCLFATRIRSSRALCFKNETPKKLNHISLFKATHWKCVINPSTFLMYDTLLFLNKSRRGKKSSFKQKARFSSIAPTNTSFPFSNFSNEIVLFYRWNEARSRVRIIR